MKHKDDTLPANKTPLWKWLVFILVALAMPLFFSFYRDAQTEQAILQTDQINANGR